MFCFLFLTKAPGVRLLVPYCDHPPSTPYRSVCLQLVKQLLLFLTPYDMCDSQAALVYIIQSIAPLLPTKKKIKKGSEGQPVMS